LRRTLAASGMTSLVEETDQEKQREIEMKMHHEITTEGGAHVIHAS
jgi:hypothetical protein